MATARDLFVFQMYTGLAYGDTQTFDINDYRLIDGTWKNTGERIKTGVPYVSQLLPPVVEILERYGWNVPEINNSDYNTCLKALGMACGIERPLHSHMARHTFATWMLRQGVPIEHVSKMLGHTNITQTQRYAKIVAADIHGDFSRIAAKMKKGKAH
jgi:integrase